MTGLFTPPLKGTDMSKYARRARKEEFVLSEESALDQVHEILEYYDIDIEALTADSEGLASGMKKTLDAITNAIRKGKLEVGRSDKEKLQVTHHLSDGTTVTYREINAASKVAMEKFKTDAGYSRTYAFMGALAGIGSEGIKKFHPVDLGIVEVLGTVFLNA